MTRGAEPDPPRPRRSRGSSLGELVLTVAVAVGLALLVETFLIKPYRIPSGSMIPTLDIGQHILVDRLDHRPALGSVVVFHPPVGAGYTAHECGDPNAGAGYATPCDRAYPVRSSQVFVKRVVGLPGDRLSVRDGIVYRNGVAEKLPYRLSAAQGAPGYYTCAGGGGTCSFARSITVPAGEYYMMGDNRGDSDDSRYWGPVPRSWIIGKAVATYWPPDRVGTL